MKQALPRFKNEEEEATFWDTHDATEFFEASDFHRVRFPNLKPTSRKITLRMSDALIAHVKEKANALGMPYQSLIKFLVQQGIKRV